MAPSAFVEEREHFVVYRIPGEDIIFPVVTAWLSAQAFPQWFVTLVLAYPYAPFS